MSNESDEEIRAKAERLTLGTRHNYENVPRTNFYKEAKKLGFSKQEIEALKRLYKTER